MVAGPGGRTRWSWLRDLMASLAKTLLRWYSTVRVLMNSRAPISGLDRPSRASRAIWASWAVSSVLVCTVRLRAVSPAAGSSRRARPANASMPISSSMAWAVRSCSRPLAVEQVSAGQLRAVPGPAEVADRLAVQAVSSLAVAEQGADAGFQSQRPLGGPHPRVVGQPLQRGPDQRYVAGPGGRLGQLGHDKGTVPELVMLECLPGGVQGGVVAAEAVAEHRAGVAREIDQPAQATCGRLPRSGLDQLSRLSLVASQGREHHLAKGERRVPGDLRDQPVFLDQ